MTEFSPGILDVLVAAGWRADRHVDVDGWRAGLAEDGLRMHAAAEAFLASFGGLKIDVRGPGVSCAREPFELNPLLASGEGDRFIDWGAETGKSLFPVGEFGEGRLFLAIDENSQIYGLSDWLAKYGPYDEALAKLISGILPDDVTPA
ncbi:SUKH-3 domain-containing protein [Amycolatopsis sp. NPDC021455]|uniref:SUKH-3 domain-containing protein n=1 Tax=Amycolatopsis sp. NPDC021455 TaxID=3154901 RepID=UPI0033DCE54A